MRGAAGGAFAALYVIVWWLIASAASRRHGAVVFALGLALLGLAFHRYRRGRPEWLLRLAYASLLAATAALLVEAALHVRPSLLAGRVANFAYTGYHPYRGGIYSFDPHLGSAMRPNARRWMYWNGHWWHHRSNTQGWRGPALEKADVVFLGDSMIYGHGVQEDETKGWSAQKLYAEAKARLTDGNYEDAIKYYQKLEARYPHGRFAQQAQLEIGYAYYKDEQPAEAISAADRFIKLHPNHPNVDYAYYLRGLTNFNGDLGWTGWIGGQDLSERDPKAATESFEAFRELVERFPNSRYAPDAYARMRYLVNALAKNEVRVAHYYLRRKAWIAVLGFLIAGSSTTWALHLRFGSIP